jgi:enediyne biosynthesis protein E4
VDAGPVVFAEVGEKAGLTRWRHMMGSDEPRFILETVGSGVALIDYDNDGWLDIDLVNGSTYGAMAGKASPPHAALFHNNHNGTSTDVAAQAGVTNDRSGFGVAVGDYDNDGWPDLYVTNFGKNRLYHNNHDGTFTDVAEKAV